MVDPLAAELAKALVDAQQRYRTRRGFGAYVTPQVPQGVIEEFAAALVPAIRKAAADAAEDHRQRIVRAAAEQVDRIINSRPREEER